MTWQQLNQSDTQRDVNKSQFYDEKLLYDLHFNKTYANGLDTLSVKCILRI